MKLYFAIIGAAMFIISAVNMIFKTASWQYIILAVIICTALQFALDGLIALTVHFLPCKFFNVDNPLYHVSKIEQKIYKKFKVRNWKDKIWEMGGLGGFSKKNLAIPKSQDYIERFIIESNKGVLTHRASYFIGFLPMAFIGNNCAFTIALPVALVNLFLNVLPTITLRYNTPRLKMILERNKRKSNTSNSEET